MRRGDPGKPDEAAEVVARTGGLVDRIALNAPYAAEPGLWEDLLKAVRERVDSTGESPLTDRTD